MTQNFPPDKLFSQEYQQCLDGFSLNAESNTSTLPNPVARREYESERCFQYSQRLRRMIETPPALIPAAPRVSGRLQTRAVPPPHSRKHQKTLQPKDSTRKHLCRQTLHPPGNPSTGLASPLIPGKSSFFPSLLCTRSHHAETRTITQTHQKRSEALTVLTGPTSPAERHRK